jgi:hypothetical protein
MLVDDLIQYHSCIGDEAEQIAYMLPHHHSNHPVVFLPWALVARILVCPVNQQQAERHDR